MKILVMGGTRFEGKSMVSKQLNQNHDIDIFTRGNKSNPDNTNLIKGDRNDIECIYKLKNKKYDVIFDISGREVEQTKILIENLDDSFIDISMLVQLEFIKITMNYLYPRRLRLILIVDTKVNLKLKIG